MNLQYGSQGDEVKKLQQTLNQNGYSLSEDGIFGANTDAAVRDYQSKNGLASDGIVGTQTSGKLYGTAASAEETKPVEKPANPSYDASTDTQYQDALKALNDQKAQGAPTYNPQYDQQLNDIYNKIMNREGFSYDLNGDALYQQYRDQYTQQGRMAMMDTMGQAAALTGGYGSTYAQAAGQQQYDAYLQSLNDIVPELYDRAYQRYADEGDRLAQQYSMTGDLRDTEYGRYMDSYNQYMDQLRNLQDQENNLYSRGYEGWLNSENMGYERQQDAYQRYLNLITSTGYSPTDEELAAAGMSRKEANQWLQYYQQQLALAMAGGSGGSGGGGGGGGSSKSSTTSGAPLISKTGKESASGTGTTSFSNMKRTVSGLLAQGSYDRAVEIAGGVLNYDDNVVSKSQKNEIISLLEKYGYSVK